MIALCALSILLFCSCNSETTDNLAGKADNVSCEFSDGYPKFIGQTIDGKKEGFWYYFEKDIVVAKGMYKHNEPEGKWEFGDRLYTYVTELKSGKVFGDEYSINMRNDTTLLRYCENDTVKFSYEYIKSDTGVFIYKNYQSTEVGSDCSCEFWK